MSEQVSANVDVKPEQPAPEKKKAKKSWLRKINPLLWVTVIVPTLCSGVYYGIFASDQFTSQSSFVVRSPKSQSSLNGLGAILRGVRFFSFSRRYLYRAGIYAVAFGFGCVE